MSESYTVSVPSMSGVRLSPGCGEVFKALVAAQVDIPVVSKDRENPHFKFKYATLDAIMAAVRGPLAKHGLAVVQGAATRSGSELLLDTMLAHLSGEWIANTVHVPIEKGNAQGAGSALTYARRYGLSALLALATEDDDDAQRGNGAAAQKPAKPESEFKAPTLRPKPEPKATKEQIADIGAFVGQLVGDGTDPAEIEKWMLRAYGTTSAGKLTKAQADDALAKLKLRAAMEPAKSD